jgi:MFS family permease
MTGHPLGRRASFWVAAAVVCHTLWTSAAPAMTYPLYAAKWGLAPTVTTAIFAIYPIVVVAVLTWFGDISDHIGRRATILLGLGASLLGVLLFAIAPSVLWIFIGRAIMGVGVGLSAGPSTAAMIEFSAADQSRRTSSITTAAQALGLASATLIGGGLIQYAPFPTRLDFWLVFVVLAALFVAAWFLPRHVADATSGRWRLKAVTVPRGIRKIFATSATAVMTGYSLGALMLSLGAQIAHDLIGSDNVLVNGAAIALFAIVWGVVGISAKRLSSRAAMMLGGAASIIGTGLLVLSTAHHALPVFLAAAAAFGVGYSLMFMGGLRLLGDSASADRCGGMLSALYLVAYLTMGVIALLLGEAATRWGLEVALDLGSAAIASLSIGAIVLAASIGRSSPSNDEIQTALISRSRKTNQWDSAAAGCGSAGQRIDDGAI